MFWNSFLNGVVKSRNAISLKTDYVIGMPSSRTWPWGASRFLSVLHPRGGLTVKDTTQQCRSQWFTGNYFPDWQFLNSGFSLFQQNRNYPWEADKSHKCALLVKNLIIPLKSSSFENLKNSLPWTVLGLEQTSRATAFYPTCLSNHLANHWELCTFCVPGIKIFFFLHPLTGLSYFCHLQAPLEMYFNKSESACLQYVQIHCKMILKAPEDGWI